MSSPLLLPPQTVNWQELRFSSTGALHLCTDLIISLGDYRRFTRAKLSSIADHSDFKMEAVVSHLGFKMFCNAGLLPCTNISLSSVTQLGFPRHAETPNKVVSSLVPSSLWLFSAKQINNCPVFWDHYKSVSVTTFSSLSTHVRLWGSGAKRKQGRVVHRTSPELGDKRPSLLSQLQLTSCVMVGGPRSLDSIVIWIGGHGSLRARRILCSRDRGVH